MRTAIHMHNEDREIDATVRTYSTISEPDMYVRIGTRRSLGHIVDESVVLYMTVRNAERLHHALDVALQEYARALDEAERANEHGDALTEAARERAASDEREGGDR